MNRQMFWLVLQRLRIAFVTLIIVSIAVFLGTQMLPGDVAQIILGQAATDEAVASLRTAMGLDQPAYIRFAIWVKGVFSGDLGYSLANKRPVAELVSGRLTASLRLAGITTLISVPIALTLGIAAAMWKGSLFDRIVSVFAISTISVPEFMVATGSVLIFSVTLQWLPALSTTKDVHGFLPMLKAFAMPVMTLSFVISAQMIRMTRAAVIETLNTPYVEMAKLKGASRSRIVLYHALPNASGPIANAVALSLTYLLGGVIIVENVFNYPGISKLMVDAVSTRDMPLIQTCAMIFCLAYLLLVTIADIIAITSNPRLRQ